MEDSNVSFKQFAKMIKNSKKNSNNNNNDNNNGNTESEKQIKIHCILEGDSCNEAMDFTKK